MASSQNIELTAELPDTHLSEALAGDYFELLKPRVMSLVVFTAAVGLIIAPGNIHPVIGIIAILCIAIGAGASGALNMWYDADIDVIMTRTQKRPIPSGRITGQEALGFGVVLSVFATIILGLATNWLAAGILAFTIFFYAVVYTMWLKRSTPQNIVIGGAAGAFPPMIGWAAVTGTVTLESVVLFSIIFLWTPPHFWALALFKQTDYEAVGVPMMPNVVGAHKTKIQMLAYAILTAICGVLPTLMGFAGLAYGTVALALGLGFVFYSWKTYRMDEADSKMTAAKKLFGFSIIYLFAIFSMFIIDRGIELAIGVL
ncbi:heme o synthase [Lentilitoribacter sp. Alg239-R112]|uniref:heme o synthase n=1 Tax=Lentilitoribacter sp. Alg239-R112 TaxID=2305987 RepID=UPI0013A6C8A5|nr:heme o synthase [Lentilitoribacter sp. Alg239-R112]